MYRFSTSTGARCINAINILKIAFSVTLLISLGNGYIDQIEKNLEIQRSANRNNATETTQWSCDSVFGVCAPSEKSLLYVQSALQLSLALTQFHDPSHTLTLDELEQKWNGDTRWCFLLVVFLGMKIIRSALVEIYVTYVFFYLEMVRLMLYFHLDFTLPRDEESLESFNNNANAI